jgi:hypothetical protein
LKVALSGIVHSDHRVFIVTGMLHAKDNWMIS